MVTDCVMHKIEGTDCGNCSGKFGWRFFTSKMSRITFGPPGKIATDCEHFLFRMIASTHALFRFSFNKMIIAAYILIQCENFVQ